MSQKIITVSVLIFLVIASSLLAYGEKKQHTLDGEWFLYFKNPKGNDMNFIIENHTGKKIFNWELNCERANHPLSKGGSVEIKKGEKKIINCEDLMEMGPDFECAKKEITVSLKDETKTIYKSLDLLYD